MVLVWNSLETEKQQSNCAPKFLIPKKNKKERVSFCLSSQRGLMSQQKRSNSWLLPSFDDSPPKKPRIGPSSKRSLLSEDIEEFENPPRTVVGRRNTVDNLGVLLDACGPKSQAELAVSRQKRNEISNWFETKTIRGKPSVLVVSGPSGCGKTVAIRVLAKEFGFDVEEWITPLDPPMDENNRFVRQGDKFEEYLIRASRYNSVLSGNSRRLLLIKDLPNVYVEHKSNFNAVLEKYFEFGKEPIVFVCTETDSCRILQKIFSQKIRDQFGIHHISLNATTQVAMKNALKRVSGILNAKAGHLLHVSEGNIDEILSNSVGDVRSAIYNLIFACLKIKNKGFKSDCKSREDPLGLLHGVGRVINPKRISEGQGKSWKFVHDPDETAVYFQSYSTVFLRFLHENYLNTMREIEDAAMAADILCDAEILANDWRDPNLGKLALSLSVRGVMIANKNPVSGWNPVRKPRNEENENLQRNLALTEIRCYESIIKPAESKNSANPSSEPIEEDAIEDFS